ncbi:HD family phosphohydrolase, partial [Desulfobacteraceae bacterium SEEP-SAG10]
RPNSFLEIGLPDDPACSPQILASIREGRLVLMQNLKTLNDFKLLQISWVFDLNFVTSFQAVKTRAYIEQIEATLPHSKE